MINNFTNINEMNNYLSPKIIKHNMWWVEIQVLSWHRHKNVVASLGLTC